MCREHSINEQTLQRWKKKYGRMEPSEAKRLRELEEENRKLKRIVADLSVDNVALKGTAAPEAHATTASWRCRGAETADQNAVARQQNSDTSGC